ncbi:uncharacterized protein FPRO_15901 [Fusarium proliferatum ET1]|uniref:Uncharacterized protein n=1 Tax=Fusarium proliferatum (strain ET1) TaxID=1227346 RepID=A0A1L7WAA7_FUSPR|nr:uncharacterized protein FPRO_15901 [Fusarium proliferatum ET1]CZR49542.1 uncharacterized protein FPRO_15901 [Fusarium proliferatum ET1]
MADLEPPDRTTAIVETLKWLVAEVRTEASKPNRLNTGDYISPWKSQKNVEDIYALLDANMNELKAAVDLVVTGNELLNLNSAKKLGLQSMSTTSENDAQSDSSQLDSARQSIRITRTQALELALDSNQMAQLEPSPNRYGKHIDDRDDVLTLELRQLGKNLAATIDALDSDVEQIQKAQVSGLAEAMKRRSTDTWDLEPKDSRNINKNAATVDS